MRRLLPCLAAGLLGAQAPPPARLPNGLALSVKEDFGRPLVRARLRLELPPRPAGLAAFALEAMEHSPTGSHSRGSFSRALDHAGLSLVRTLGSGTLTWELTGPPQSFDAGLALLADQVLRPQVDGTALERARLRLYRDLQAQSPAARALRRARAKLGAREGPLAEETLLTQAGQPEVEAFLRDALRPERAHLAIEGAVGASQARTAAFLAFGAWPAAAVPGAPDTAPPAPARLTLVPGNAPGAWMGVDLSGFPRAFLALLALAAPEAAPSGADLELHPGGFALRASGEALPAIRKLQSDLDTFARRGLTTEALETAKRRHAAGEVTLGLHPALSAAEGLAGEVQALDVATFNALLREAFGPAHRHAVLVGLPPKEAAGPDLAFLGEAEVWVEARGAFLRRSAAAQEAPPPRR